MDKLFFLSALVLFTGLVFVAADEEEDMKKCKGEMKEMLKTAKEIVDNKEGAECIYTLELDQYFCGGDEDKGKELVGNFMKMMKDKEGEERQEIIDCMEENDAKVMEQVEMSDECKEMMAKFKKMMEEKMKEE